MCESYPREIDYVNLPELLEKLKTENVSVVPNINEYAVVFKALDDDTSKITRSIQEVQILKTSLKVQKRCGTGSKSNAMTSKSNAMTSKSNAMTSKSNVVTLPSFWDVWQNNEEFRLEIINSSDPNEEKWRLTRKYGYKIATTFMPNYAKTIYQYFGNPQVVLDPCSGWGDRMLGAEVAGIRKYIGFDPNRELRSGYSQIMNLCDHQVVNSSDTNETMLFSNSYEIHSSPFETGSLNLEDNSVDFVFTSPPFFDYEIYSSENPTYNDWITEFYEPLFIQCCRIVKPQGYVCIYIGDTSAGKIEDFIKNRVKQICRLRLEPKCIGFHGLWSQNIRKIWIFKKG
jgi:hypothetical protein